MSLEEKRHSLINQAARLMCNEEHAMMWSIVCYFIVFKDFYDGLVWC